jgi:hypothetical protein
MPLREAALTFCQATNYGVQCSLARRAPALHLREIDRAT